MLLYEMQKMEERSSPLGTTRDLLCKGCMAMGFACLLVALVLDITAGTKLLGVIMLLSALFVVVVMLAATQEADS